MGVTRSEPNSHSFTRRRTWARTYTTATTTTTTATAAATTTIVTYRTTNTHSILHTNQHVWL